MYEIVPSSSGSVPITNDAYLSPGDSSINISSEQLSQTGSENALNSLPYQSLITTSGNSSKDQSLHQLRQLLMRGQPRIAITVAQNNGLFDHALALSYLMSFQFNSPQNSVVSTDNNLIIGTIRKFITTTLSSSDPRELTVFTCFHISLSLLYFSVRFLHSSASVCYFFLIFKCFFTKYSSSQGGLP